MSIIEEFPILYNYVLSAESPGNMITNANIVIVNIRSILGWANENNPYSTRITDVKCDKNMSELATITDTNQLIQLIQTMVKVILFSMKDILQEMPEDRAKVAIENICKCIHP